MAVIAVGLAACGSSKPAPKRPRSASVAGQSVTGQATTENVATGPANYSALPCKSKVPLTAAGTKSMEAYIRKQIVPRLDKGQAITAAEDREVCKLLHSAKWPAAA